MRKKKKEETQIINIMNDRGGIPTESIIEELYE